MFNKWQFCLNTALWWRIGMWSSSQLCSLWFALPESHKACGRWFPCHHPDKILQTLPWRGAIYLEINADILTFRWLVHLFIKWNSLIHKHLIYVLASWTTEIDKPFFLWNPWLGERIDNFFLLMCLCFSAFQNYNKYLIWATFKQERFVSDHGFGVFRP